ncbi:hypothetical protein RUM44_007675 [Polyplax serrata]|uniref:Dynamin-type G domain-containing protein n=1 Tax=Polyplax serrata TaxID=468196 RepID=A0ABR1B726_POLSC
MGTCSGHIRRPSSARGWIKLALLGIVLSVFIQVAACDSEPTESQCRPYIEKALKEQHLEGEDAVVEKTDNADLLNEKDESQASDEQMETTDSSEVADDQTKESKEDAGEADDDGDVKTDDDETDDDGKTEEEPESEDNDADQQPDGNDDDNDSAEKDGLEVESAETDKDDDDDKNDTKQNTKDETAEGKDDEDDDGDNDESLERPIEVDVQEVEIDDNDDDDDDDDIDNDDKTAEKADSKEQAGKESEENKGKESAEETKSQEEDDDKSTEKDNAVTEQDDKSQEETVEETAEATDKVKSIEEKEESKEKADGTDDDGKEARDGDSSQEKGDDKTASDEKEPVVEEKIIKVEIKTSKTSGPSESGEEDDETNKEEPEAVPEEEELTQEVEIPDNLRERDHIDKILKLEEDGGLEKILEKTIDTTLKSLKGLYDNAIKPLEMLYKYRDLSNRHYGDPEIFSKPLILFMGPWSGGKSSTINYLLNNEFSHTSLRTGAEPSPAYFNILMYGDEEEILDGTQLAADWTFSGLQKFGQGLLDRLKGVKLPNKLLEKVNIVEIPGILEIRKQVQRLFPFNDACQWFIDRADIIFLVYDPSKLDVGPETEAILDQLKGREYQTRIILNKADQVKPEELMRVQGTLIWNISPLMSSTEPPIMYSTSLWSMPYEAGAPTRLLLAQERAFLKDLREAIDKRVENKISSARRFAVRVRNHAKMVDCYLTTYYNHKSFFGNRKRISDDIIENPQKYHIYEGLSTLTNISRYDLPDPDVYQDFFKINPLYEFKKLSETCTYFRGCPINKLDVAIAYDLPELVGKYRKAADVAKEQLQKEKS